jgi:hypothetical protein
MLARLTLKEMIKRPAIMAVVALLEPVALRRMAWIWLGWRSMSSTEPMAEIRTFTIMNPSTPFIKMDQNIALGTADLALRVSSDMWIALSKPSNC